MSRTILITGASGHVGSGMARYFAERGYSLVLTGRDELRLAQVAEACRDLGAHVDTHLLDLNGATSVDAVANSAGHVDWLINNAADVTSLPLMETDPTAIAQQISANVTGTMLLTRAILPGMLAEGRGAIVNISSLAGYKANPGQTVYSVTKSAMNAFSEALRMDLRNESVAIVNVALASVSEGDTPKRGQVTARDVAVAIERAIETGKSEVYFSTLTRVIMKVYAAFPGLRLLRPPHATSPGE